MKKKTDFYKDYNIHYFEELDSTNNYAIQLAKAGIISDKEVICANSQNAGKGRNQRKWESPIGNLYFSLVIKPKILIEKIPQVSFLSIVSLRSAIEKIFIQQKISAEIKNKWPNDLLINDKKIAGLLLESDLYQNYPNFLVIGIGINLISNPEKTVVESGNLESFGIKISKEEMLTKFLEEFDYFWQNYLDYGFVGIRKNWLEYAYKLQKEILIELNNQKINGVFINLDQEGNLLLEHQNQILTIKTSF